MNRRDYLLLAGGAALAASAGCSRVGQRLVKARDGADAPSPLLAPGTGDKQHDPNRRFLDRAGYGAAPGDIERLSAIGRKKWLEEQLEAPVAVGVPSLVGLGWNKLTGGDDTDGESAGLLYRLSGIEPLHLDSYEERDWPEAKIREALTQAALLRAVYSKWQLRERMVAFWSDHFNIYGAKVVDFGKAYATTHLTYYLNRDQTDVIRRHVLGHFPDLLQASARSPAMLGYLDNQLSKSGTANENYAREIMELHTLGIGGGYTQKDVQEVARCLTGWGIEHRYLHKRGTFFFDPAKHDNGAKVVLGTAIPAGGGENDGEHVLRLLAKHPSTARFISRKLVHHFRGEENEVWIARLAAIYTKTGGDIAAMLQPMLEDESLTDSPPILKRPWDYLASALRASNADTDGGEKVQGHLADMGQPLFEWPMPNGYPEKTSSWTGSLLARWNFAFALCNKEIERTTLPKLTGDTADKMALALCAPEFQWR